MWRRISSALARTPTGRDWAESVVLLLIFAAVYVPLGLGNGFLHWQPVWKPLLGLRLLLIPSIPEELLFRAALIPGRCEGSERWAPCGLSWVLFILAHPWNPWGPDFFASPIFLIGAALLGLVCTISYLRSDSIWTAVVLHWGLVSGWFLLFGGSARFP